MFYIILVKTAEIINKLLLFEFRIYSIIYTSFAIVINKVSQIDFLHLTIIIIICIFDSFLT